MPASRRWSEDPAGCRASGASCGRLGASPWCATVATDGTGVDELLAAIARGRAAIVHAADAPQPAAGYAASTIWESR